MNNGGPMAGYVFRSTDITYEDASSTLRQIPRFYLLTFYSSPALADADILSIYTWYRCAGLSDTQVGVPPGGPSNYLLAASSLPVSVSSCHCRIYGTTFMIRYSGLTLGAWAFRLGMAAERMQLLCKFPRSFA